MMRGFLLATFVLIPMAALDAQDRHGPSIYDDLRDQGSIYDRGIRGGHHRHGGHHHVHGGLGRLYGHGLTLPYGYGYGFSGYGTGFGIRGPGYGFNTYTGPSYVGPLINPPVLSPLVYGYAPTYGYSAYGYGSYGYNPGYGYGSSYFPPNPVNNQWLQQQYNNEWTRLQAELGERLAKNLTDPTAATTRVPIPSSPEDKIKSLRYQAQGDFAFKEQNWGRALDRYERAAKIAEDDGTARLKMAYAQVAIGRYSQAVDSLRRALQLEPLLASTGPPPAEMYGDQRIAWTTHLGRLTRWVAEEVRDAERVLLLGAFLFLDGDPRGKEFLEKAWQLSGGRAKTVVTLLRRPEVEVERNAVEQQPAEPPAPRDPNENEAAPVVPGPDELIPPPPQEQAGQGEPVAEGPALGADNQPAAPPETVRPAPRASDASPQVNAETPATPDHQPLFPLPSEQERDSSTDVVPPLPSPEP